MKRLKRKKRLIISGLLVCALLLGSLTACGREKTAESADSSVSSSVTGQPVMPAIITAAPDGSTQSGSSPAAPNDTSENSSLPSLPSLFSPGSGSSAAETPAPGTAAEAASAAEAAPAQEAAPAVQQPASEAAPAAQQPAQEAAPAAEQPAAAATPAQQQPAAPTTQPAQSGWAGSNMMPTPSMTPSQAQSTPAPTTTGDSITIYGGIEAPASDFLFPYSSTQVLSDSDLQYLLSLSSRDMHFEAQLAISEIYARYGYTFKKNKETSQYVRDRIADKDWYKQVQDINPSQDQETLRWQYFNDIERKNVQILLDFQNTYDHYTS